MLDFETNIADTKLSPIIKWAGGKESELPIIHACAPTFFENYYEPFVGGGSVFMSFTAKKAFINDKSAELISLYRAIALQEQGFFFWADKICTSWDNLLHFAATHDFFRECYISYRDNKITDSQLKATVKDFLNTNEVALQTALQKEFNWHRDVYSDELYKNLSRKMPRMKKIEQEKGVMPPSDIFDNIETAFMSSLYMYFRALYNDAALMKENTALATGIFFFIRNYAYSGMFRYNAAGEFNVPYGGIGYNHKLLHKKIDYYTSSTLLAHFANTVIGNTDFHAFLEQYTPTEQDFMFLDPPYDSEFSTYAKNEFTKADQARLAQYLIQDCKAKWLLVIKNTPYIYSLYDGHGLHISSFDKNYKVSFMNRNDRNTEHLIVRNY